jgi:hypothetical protein
VKRRRAVIIGALTIAIAVAEPAVAGAPNYECAIGSYRIGIDQHRRAGLVRERGAGVQSLPFVDADQNGPTLGLVVKLDGADARIDVRNTGRAASLSRSDRTSRGVCAFIPGDFALGEVTARRLVLRLDPDDAAPTVIQLKQRSLVWSSGRFDAVRQEMRGTQDWARFRAVLRVRGGATDGGPEQLGMGQLAGLDGRSTIVEGWGRIADVAMLGPPGP